MCFCFEVSVSVLQYVYLFYSMCVCFAVSVSVLQYLYLFCSMCICFAVCVSVLQYLYMFCSMCICFAVTVSVLQYLYSLFITSLSFNSVLSVFFLVSRQISKLLAKASFHHTQNKMHVLVPSVIQTHYNCTQYASCVTVVCKGESFSTSNSICTPYAGVCCRLFSIPVCNYYQSSIFPHNTQTHSTINNALLYRSTAMTAYMLPALLNFRML